MTVSCNCQGYDAESCIGNLSENTLDEIFRGPRASLFRETLAGGSLPLDTCMGCSELRTVAAEDAEKYLEEFTLPVKGIMLENTVLCNLSCLACVRKTLIQTRNKKWLSPDDIRRVSATIRECGIETLYFFKFGEPFMSPTILQELEIIRRDNPELNIVISTNGSVLNTDEKRQAALLANHIFFSIDGISDEMVQKYQVKGSFVNAYENMELLTAERDAKGLTRPVIEWKYVLFNWNDRQDTIRRAIELAQAAQVDVISFWPTSIPWYGRSWRYHLKGYFKNIGKPVWKGREVDFRASEKPD